MSGTFGPASYEGTPFPRYDERASLSRTTWGRGAQCRLDKAPPSRSDQPPQGGRERVGRGSLRDCRRESPALEGGDESPSSSTFSARRGCRCPPRISLCIRRGTSAPLSGQSDKLGCIRPTPDGPPSGDVGIGSDTGTSESADERRKPRGNDGTRRFEERSNSHVTWLVETTPRWLKSLTRTRLLHEPETPNPTRCGAGVGILALQAGEDVNWSPRLHTQPRSFENLRFS